MIQLYVSQSQDPRYRIKRFHGDFQKALQTPHHMSWVGKVYTDGLMCHISYSELGPSFVAWVNLHEALYKVMADLEPRDVPMPGKMEEDFWQASEVFLKRVEGLGHLTEVRSYEAELDRAYQDFLLEFMRRHPRYFKVRFEHHVLKATTKGHMLDAIDCSFFALRDDGPDYEKFPHKLQCEPLRVHLCQDGNLLILGYNTRPYTCSPVIHVYRLSAKDKNPIFIPLPSIPGGGFELSAKPRSGGCGAFDHLDEFVIFDGRYLKISGYDYIIYREVTYDTERDQWDISASHGPDSSPS